MFVFAAVFVKFYWWEFEFAKVHLVKSSEIDSCSEKIKHIIINDLIQVNQDLQEPFFNKALSLRFSLYFIFT